MEQLERAADAPQKALDSEHRPSEVELQLERAAEAPRQQRLDSLDSLALDRKLSGPAAFAAPTAPRDMPLPAPVALTEKKDLHHSSKYDLVKVKVWLNEQLNYYVLSRFLVSRMLTVTKVVHSDAVTIALDLKKLLIDEDKVDVTQAEVENMLFQIMTARGYGSEFIFRYQMMSSFHSARVAMIVLIGGTACIGKSTLSTQLAERLNLSCVIQTTLVYEVLRSVLGYEGGKAEGLNFEVPLWFRDDVDTPTFIGEFRRECQAIREGLQGDIRKCMDEGKSIIIEGTHLDMDFYRDIIESASNSWSGHGPPAGEEPASERRNKKCIVVPFMLTLEDTQHSILVDNWFSAHGDLPDLCRLAPAMAEQKAQLIERWRWLSCHLQRSEALANVSAVPVAIHSLHETLDVLHDTVLRNIQSAYPFDQEP